LSEKYLYIKKNWCKRCYICVEFCPKKVYVIGSDGYPEIEDINKCVECRLCLALCPDYAIISDPEIKKELEAR